MLVSDFDYYLPPELIARHPAPRRDGSRMMVIHRATGSIEHRAFTDFVSFIRDGDLVVFNNARVVPARVICDDPPGELLMTGRSTEGIWRCLARPARRFKTGRQVRLAGTTATVVGHGPMGVRFLRCEKDPDFEKYGHMPLPPYLGREDEPEDRVRYQTVYASRPGAVAAPTAGLHFTVEIMERLPRTFVTLHVGEGTFRDIKTEHAEDHVMHKEPYEISGEAARLIGTAGRVIAVGTTVVRTLEAAAIAGGGEVKAGPGETDLFIRPGFSFQITGALLTNFHLPRSTLLMLVCAFAGSDLVREAYARAVEQRYRFFSYGDCMLIV